MCGHKAYDNQASDIDSLSLKVSVMHQVHTFTLDQHADAMHYFFEFGYAVIKQLFTPAEIAAAHAATDRLKKRAGDVGASSRHGNAVFWVNPDANLGINVQGMQWPSYFEPALDAMRIDDRMGQILRPVLGENIRQIINQIHWKTPGSTFAVNFHRDRENRRPVDAFRFLERTYIQTGIAIDPMTSENSPLLVIPHSHRKTDSLRPANRTTNFAAGNAKRDDLHAFGYGEADLVPLLADAGDLVLWHVDTIHGSDGNRSATLDRCLYINGYVDARHCMRGHWAFMHGKGVPILPIDVPVLVHLDDIFNRLNYEVLGKPTKAYD